MDFNSRVPKAPRKNLVWRRWLLQRAAANRRVRQGLLEACKRDPLFWVNAFAWQYNPNAIGHNSLQIGPFVTWPFQDAAYRTINGCVDGRRDCVIEKSREMGASWLCLLVLTHRILFLDYQKFLVISRDEAAVDKTADPDALFWKVDFVLAHLPPWMQEGRCSPDARDTRFRNKNHFNNPLTGSVMTGQASTATAGVGGRATAMFVDEFAKIKDDAEIMQYTAGTTNCRIFNSTHGGTGTAFYRLTRPESPAVKLRMHWTDHPDKVHGLYRSDPDTGALEVLDPAFEYPAGYPFVRDGKTRSPWYDAQCQRIGSAKGAAVDLDINPEGSVDQVFSHGLIDALVRRHCREPAWRGELLYDAATGRPDRFEADPKGKLALWVPLVGPGAVPLSEYAIGVDNSTGQGATPQCVSVVDCRTGNKVAEYANAWIKPDDLAPYVTALGWVFATEPRSAGLLDRPGDPATLIWEAVGPGSIMAKEILKLGYPRVYYRPAGKGLMGSGEPADTPGFNPSPQNTRVLLAAYEKAIASGRFVNPSRAALEEALLFKYNARGEVEHSKVKSRDNLAGAGVSHSDMAVADALACLVMEKLNVLPVPSTREVIHEGSLSWRRKMFEIREKEAENWI